MRCIFCGKETDKSLREAYRDGWYSFRDARGEWHVCGSEVCHRKAGLRISENMGARI